MAQKVSEHIYLSPYTFQKRFHGISPTMARQRHIPIQPFLPLKINYSIQGGQQLNYRREKMDSFTLIGFEEEFSFPSYYSNIPKFCKELNRKFFNKPESEYQWAIKEYNIGEYGAVIHDVSKGSFRYMVAGMYLGGEVPDGLNLETFKTTEWLKFTCTGANPNAIQRLNTQIFRDWRFKHPEFKLGSYNIEWYSDGDNKSANYKSGIWVPLRNNVEEN